VREVLVFQLARFGDIVQSKRLLLSLAAQENTRVHFCVDHSMTALAAMLYPFAEIHGLPAHNSGTEPAAVADGARKTFAVLREKDFSEVYPLNFSPLSFACASLFQPEILRGYARVQGQDMRGKLSQIAFNLMRDRRFAPLNLMDLWAAFHPSALPPEQVNPIPKAAGTKRIGIVMAGRESRRSLPVRELALCVQAIFQARGGPRLVCIGSKAERLLVRRLAGELPPSVMQNMEDLTGKTSLTDLPEVLGSLDMVLTPDTGAMHLAAHLGVPVQAFFLSSAWCWETGPYGFGHKIWQALDTCSPCRESDVCKTPSACLRPFSHPAFLNHLAGKAGADWPEGLLGCITSLDRLGATCKTVDGDDPYETARRELRSGLLDYLNGGRADAPAPFLRQELAEFLFTEKDWMLPGNWRQVPFTG
jgi:ADP-heptose:LPS heptosyltransferase